MKKSAVKMRLNCSENVRNDFMNISDIIKTDVLVFGGGIAGVKSAYTAVNNGCSAVLITKSTDCASNYILGFNAPLGLRDSAELYAEDTVNGGGGINNISLVKTLCENAVSEIEFTEKSGLEFDRSKDGYHLLKPLGCTVPRLAHIENRTGRISLEKFLSMAEENGVKIISDAMLSDIIVENGRAVGASVLDLKNRKEFYVCAKSVVIATGGIHIAEGSTYPVSMTGDGYAAAYRAGACLTDMEFIQFEPCRCIYPQKLGISTTLLAKGGKITNRHGERFLLKNYKSEGDIQKDALAKLIYKEITDGKGTEHGGVYLDLTDIDETEIKENHSLYYKRFKNAGIDITKQKIETAPCAHSFMGGIVIDSECKTCVDGLFAAGEVTGGIHGANRVGGNAGTEVYVFGTKAGNSAVKYAKNTDFESLAEKAPVKKKKAQNREYFENIKIKIRALMSENMGPVRNGENLETAYKAICGIEDEIKSFSAFGFDAAVSKKECENSALVCKCAIYGALLRKESRGVHFRTDYPETKSEYKKNFLHKRDFV